MLFLQHFQSQRKFFKELHELDLCAKIFSFLSRTQQYTERPQKPILHRTGLQAFSCLTNWVQKSKVLHYTDQAWSLYIRVFFNQSPRTLVYTKCTIGIKNFNLKAIGFTQTNWVRGPLSRTKPKKSQGNPAHQERRKQNKRERKKK